MADDLNRFRNLTYEGFQQLAKDPSLSPHERIGFPDSYREGKEQVIFADICSKLLNLAQPGGVVVDIGPGCSPLAELIVAHCERQGQKLVLIDSAEMLAHLPDKPFIEKVAGFFPSELEPLVSRLAGKAAVVLSYSVLHYVFPRTSAFDFLDAALSMLSPGGELLIGDIPNVSMRRRFFASETGVRFHQAFTRSDTLPEVSFNTLERGAIDDALMLSMMMRARSSGYDGWIVRQAPALPMANRREDLLFRRP